MERSSWHAEIHIWRQRRNVERPIWHFDLWSNWQHVGANRPNWIDWHNRLYRGHRADWIDRDWPNWQHS
jgi:hypothetical protein